MYFLRRKDDTAQYFMKYLIDIAPRKVEMVSSDGGRSLKASLMPCVFEKRLSRSLRYPRTKRRCRAPNQHYRGSRPYSENTSTRAVSERDFPKRGESVG